MFNFCYSAEQAHTFRRQMQRDERMRLSERRLPKDQRMSVRRRVPRDESFRQVWKR